MVDLVISEMSILTSLFVFLFGRKFDFFVMLSGCYGIRKIVWNEIFEEVLKRWAYVEAPPSPDFQTQY